MGGAARFMALLAAPFPPFRPSFVLLHRCISSASGSSLRLLALSSPSDARARSSPLAKSFHSQPNNNPSYGSTSPAPPQPHPWPEWTYFLNFLSTGQGFHADYRIPPNDAFVECEELPENFLRVASSCIAFSRARPDLLRILPRRDIEAVVSNGTPFLFKSAIDTARRMKAFLGNDGSNVAEMGTPTTTDIMKYILSYAYNPTVSSDRNGVFDRGIVDSSVRNLLKELSRISSGVASIQQFSDREVQSPRPLGVGPNIQMKRGDWICPKCNFMNFARNVKCLECEEDRPKGQVIGSEWECPQCNFHNNGRNRMCLRCDCRKPGTPLFNSGSDFKSNNHQFASHSPAFATSPRNSSSDSQRNSRIGSYQNGSSDALPSGKKLGDDLKDYGDPADIQNREPDQGDWFRKIAELHNVKDIPSSVSDEKLPEMTPIRKGENRAQKFKNRIVMDQTNHSNYVPFVPFPPGFFAQNNKETQASGKDSSKDGSTGGVASGASTLSNSSPPLSSSRYAPSEYGSMATTGEASSQVGNFQSGSWTGPSLDISEEAKTERTRDIPEPRQIRDATSTLSSSSTPQSGNAPNFQSSWRGPSLEESGATETIPLDMSEEAKAERWFKRVAEIKDLSELSQIPDEDFPSIMPMRKGVNRFVVSKRKTPLERRLTSQQYRRNLPVVSNENFKNGNDNS